MSTVDNQPSNPNPLSPINFKFVLQRLPGVNYTVQAAAIPTITVGEPPLENYFVKMPVPGDKVIYGQLDLRFQVDEDLRNYREIHNWMVGLGFPEDFNQSIHRDPRDNLDPLQQTNTGIFSDATLIIMTSARNPNIKISFKDLWPISLGTLQFDVTQPDIIYLEADATFDYRSFKIESV